ncbi:nitroreductase family protein [Streptomyces sp. CG 926]|uniref:Acg family FMN-binding oxidoreductase n=1 Tax=Streptomyces sp. CG 926 TaxID=1882405 RepID=UPI000D6CC5DF|nr:nitroreductase family protein [Streptomyces sp. CG 926]PWK65194.1 nitroreductase family protein [Streptomyces sp. CG 926]
MSATHLDPEVTALLVGDAVSAPSMHNAQPWKFVFRTTDSVIELHGDPERAMTRTDPDHRSLHLGCAAALFNLRVSAARHHRPLRVRLLPDASEPWLLATATLDDSTGTELELEVLYEALGRRHTSRYPFSDEVVPEALLDGLKAAARLEGCRLVVPGDWHVETVLGLVRDAEHREEIDPLVQVETAAWTAPSHGGSAGQRDDGIPTAAFGPRSSGGPSPVRDFGRSQHMPDRGWAVFEKRPQLALLGTTGDTRADWLRAGQALQRVLLQATSDGLATSMTSQPLEWRELRWTVRDPAEAMGHVQMVIRLGYGPQGPTTPRRPVTEVLEIR